MKELAYERVEGFACKVEPNEFDDFKKAARIADLPVYEPDDHDPKYPYYAWDGSDLCSYSGIEHSGFILIPLAEFVSKLKGEPFQMTKAEALSRYNITITD